MRPVLNREQKHTVDSILNDYIRDVRGTYLIHGITGSGKTEVYMNIVEKVICLGKQVIVLIPEISLTFQMVNRFYKRFGNRISVMHSRLSAGERFDQYTRAKNGRDRCYDRTEVGTFHTVSKSRTYRYRRGA